MSEPVRAEIVESDDIEAVRQAVRTWEGAAGKLSDQLNEAQWLLLWLNKRVLNDSQRLLLDMQLGESWRQTLAKAERRAPKTGRALYRAPS